MIYGHRISYRESRDLAKLPTLEERRDQIIKKFVIKVKNNENYRPYGYELRKFLRYNEETAKTERLYGSPIFTFRRILNNEIK